MPAVRASTDLGEVPIDVREFHEYAAVWSPERVTFHVDGDLVRTVKQAPAYPMQFMLGIYDFAQPQREPSASNRFVVDWFRAYRPPPHAHGSPMSG